MPEFVQAIVVDAAVNPAELKLSILRHRARRLLVPAGLELGTELKIEVISYQLDALDDLVAALGPGPNLILAPREERKSVIARLKEAAVPHSAA